MCACTQYSNRRSEQISESKKSFSVFEFYHWQSCQTDLVSGQSFRNQFQEIMLGIKNHYLFEEE